MWVELLKEYSLQSILVGIIMLALALKGTLDFIEWAKNKYKIKFDNDYQKKQSEELSKAHYESCQKQYNETKELYNSVEKKIDSLTDTVNTRLDNIENSIDRLTESDMHDIKGWIVEKHHMLMKQQWVDDFTMDTIEKRYADYKIEGGNSYIRGLMDEIRALPHVSSTIDLNKKDEGEN